MESTATLKQIARMLQISVSTVSRALKDHPDIAAQTKKRVRELAEMVDYEPNTLAVRLRTNASNLIGLIVPEISGFFYHSFIAGVEEEARSWGYSLMILQSNHQPETELSNLRLCKFNRTAGILVALSGATEDLSAFRKLKDGGIPIVFFDKVPDAKDFAKVSVADAEAGYLAADAIIRRGCKQVLALFGTPALSITKKRLKAFTGTFKKQAPDIRLEIRHAGNAEESREQTLQWMGRPDRPDTVFCMSDEILTGAMKAIQQSRLTIPQDIRVLAISNGFIPTLYDPETTYVETSGNALGRKSFEVLLKCMRNNPPLNETTIAARLVSGGSL